MRIVWPIHIKQKTGEVFVLKMEDKRNYKIYGVCHPTIPEADVAENLFERLWEKHEKDQALV